MSFIGMVFIIASPFWSYWTASGGWLMMGLGVTFLLIARDVEYEKMADDEAETQRIKELKRRRLREAMQHKPETEPVMEEQIRQRPPEEST